MYDASLEWDERGYSTASQLHFQAEDAMRRRQYAVAIQLLQESIELCPHYKSLELLGECMIETGEYLRAIVPLAAATGLHTQPRAPAFLAKAFYELGEFKDARKYAEEALRRNPSYGFPKEILLNLPPLDEDGSFDEAS